MKKPLYCLALLVISIGIAARVYAVSACGALTTTRTTTLTVTSGNTYSNYRISTTSGPCIIGNGASNVIIEDSEIGPCGSSSGSDNSGVHFVGGSGNAVYDSYIHVQTNGSGNALSAYDGIWFDGSTNGTAQGNVVGFAGVCIESNTSGTVATGNFCLNNVNSTDSGADAYSVGLGFDGASAPQTNSNYVLECTNGSGNGVACSTYIGATPVFEYENVTDLLSVFSTNNGSFENDWLIGGHECNGDALTADEGSSSNTFANEQSIGSQGGQQVNDGTNNTITSSISRQTQNMCGTDVPFAVLNDYPGSACGPSNLTNDNGWSTARSVGFYNAGNCGTVVTTGSNFTSSATSPGTPPLIPPIPKNCVVLSPFTTFPTGATPTPTTVFTPTPTPSPPPPPTPTPTPPPTPFMSPTPNPTPAPGTGGGGIIIGPTTVGGAARVQ